jgi:anti-sigma factor RsiW
MSSIMCDDREKLIAYLYDEASAAERRQVDEHLADCGTCREELRGLRSVRQDLLSWDVPEHGSVWTPFAAPRVTEWWRQVQAWGLAAASTLVFGSGLAGGFLAHRFTAVPVAAQVQAQAPAAAPQTVAATPEQVRELEERLASIERVALRQTAGHPASSNITLTRAEFQAMLRDTEDRINKKWSGRFISMVGDLNRQSDRNKADLMQQINQAQAQTYGNLMKVTNSRTVEKEKER